MLIKGSEAAVMRGPEVLEQGRTVGVKEACNFHGPLRKSRVLHAGVWVSFGVLSLGNTMRKEEACPPSRTGRHWG